MKKLTLFRLIALMLAIAGFLWSEDANAVSLSDLTYNKAGGYYEISSVQDMLNLSAYVSEGNNCEGLTFKVVVSELDFKDVENFTPIGLDLSFPSSSEFSGLFDGNNAVIKNLTINSNLSSIGLFLEVKNGTIKNVIMDATCSISGGGGSGSIVGYLTYNGMILNCSSSASVEGPYTVGGIVGTVSNAIVSESSFDGIVTGETSLGGISGDLHNSGIIKNCSNKGLIKKVGDKSQWGDKVGGIVGHNDGGSIIDCSNVADISSYCHVGGIVGDSEKGIVRNCTNTGNVSAEAGQAGGIVGYNVNSFVNGRRTPGIIDCSNSGSITASYFGGGIAGGNYGGIVRCTNSGNVTCGKSEDGKYATGDVKYSSWCGGIFGYGISGEVIDSKVTKGVVIKGEANCVGGISGFDSGGFYSGCIVEEAIIGVDDITGNGSEGRIGGIIGWGYENMVIKDCTNKAKVSGGGYIGGIAGQLETGGVVSNCVNIGNVSAQYNYAGGIIGFARDVVMDQCQNHSSVIADSYVGGIIGNAYGNGLISNSLVTGGTMTSSNFTGAIIGYSNIPFSENYYTKDVVVINYGKTYDGTTPRGVGDFAKNEPNAYDLPEMDVDGATYYNCAVLKPDYVPEQPVTLDDLTQIADSAYAIGSVEDMVRLSDYVNAGNTCKGFAFRVSSAVLDFSEVLYFKPIGHEGCRFAGTFDGQGVRISNLRIEEDSLSTCVGLFGYVTGTVRNVHLDNSCVVSGGSFVGGIAGKCWGAIEDCTVGDDFAAADARQTRNEAVNVCMITGKSEVGGIAGGLYYGQMSDCRVVSGMVSGNSYVGSVLGYNFNGALSENYYEQPATVKVGATLYDGDKPRGLGAEADTFPTDVSESVVDGVTYQNGIVQQSGPVNHIQSVVSSEVYDDAWYDLSGRRVVGRNLSKGVYIHQSRKVVVR